MWFVTHPEVRIDNQFDDDVAVFVDGEKVTDVKRKSNSKINVYKGEREIGWAASGESKPKETLKADVGMGGDFLFNPGKTACYWVDVTVYGDADAGGIEWGPLPVAEWYAFESIDNWFNRPTSRIRHRPTPTRAAIPASR